MILYADVTVPGDWPEMTSDTEEAAMKAAEVGWREGYFRDDAITWGEREATFAERIPVRAA